MAPVHTGRNGGTCSMFRSDAISRNSRGPISRVVIRPAPHIRQPELPLPAPPNILVAKCVFKTCRKDGNQRQWFCLHFFASFVAIMIPTLINPFDRDAHRFCNQHRMHAKVHFLDEVTRPENDQPLKCPAIISSSSPPVSRHARKTKTPPTFIGRVTCCAKTTCEVLPEGTQHWRKTRGKRGFVAERCAMRCKLVGNSGSDCSM